VNRLILGLLLLLPMSAYGQVIVGEAPPASKVADAEKTIRDAQPKKVILKVGEFEVVEPGKNAKPLQYVSLNSDSYFLWEIAPGEAFAFGGIRRGDAAEKKYSFPAQPYRWAIIKAVKQGSDVLVINRNGANTDKDPPEEVERLQIAVGEPKPDPPKPDPPGPAPQPMPSEGFRVLIVRETKDLSSLPASQVAIFSSTEVRQYLNQKTLLEGNQRAYRIWDQNTDISRESETWKIAMDGVINGNKTHNISKATSLPWILLTNGKEGYEGPLPNDVDKMMELLRKYGEGK
jgi:hypothetical protein